jgi:outer membrane protein insertion porin family
MKVVGIIGGHFVKGAAAVAAALSFVVLVSSAAAQERPPEQFKLNALTIKGNQRQKAEAIVAAVGLRVGEPVGPRDIPRAIRRLFATGWFEDIKPWVTEGDSGKIALEIEVKEWPWIASIDFRGLQHVRAGTVLDSAHVRAPTPLSPNKITDIETTARRLLASEGFQLRSIRHDTTAIPGRPGEYRLNFDAVEGSRVALADIDFSGNKVFDSGDLKGALGTKEEGFWWFRTGTYDEDKLRTDLREKLPAYYQTKGYLDFAVVGDSIAIDPVSGKAKLIIQVDEGPQYKIAEFNVVGNRHFSTEEVKRFFEEEAGTFLGVSLGAKARVKLDSVFDAVAFTSAKDRVRQAYSNQGYLYAQISENVEKIPGTNSVRATWEIQEGEPAYINKVSVVGNTFTHEDVIRNQMLMLPGDVYSEQLLIESYRRIGATGFFEMPMPTPRIEPQENGDVNITFEVKEKQTGSVNFGTAVGGGTGLAGFLGYDQPNLFGKAKGGHLRWEFGRYSNNFEASYTDPAIADSRYSGSLSLFSARDRFFRFSEGQRRRTGISMRAGTALPRDIRSRFSVGYTLSRTTYEKFEEDESSSLFSLPPGVQSTVTLNLTRQTLDHPMFPTSGTRLELEGNFSGGPLGGNGDFQKYFVTGNWYVPVGQIGSSAAGARPIRMTLGLTAESGFLFGDASRFPFERFSMGGVQFGRPLRGYDETTITPRGYFPRSADIPLEERFGDAYLRLSAEYAIRFNDNLSVGLFYDAGNVYADPRDFDSTRLMRGAGVGVMLVTPFGPIGLDYAYGFDKTKPGWQLHFKFGQGF